MLNTDTAEFAVLNHPTFDTAGQDQINTYQPFSLTQGKSDTVLTLDQLDQLPNINGNKALLLTEADSPAELTLPLEQLNTIIVYFPSFVDGRGYSYARLLRRMGFKGELRAAGDVFKDVIFYLKRSGFNSFTLKAGKEVEDAKLGLQTFTSGYQSDAQNSSSHFQIGQAVHVKE